MHDARTFGKPSAGWRRRRRRIGVATADLYPRISLGGSAGLIGGGFDAILTPLMTWAFPNQSAARAKIAAARGGEAAALASWDAAILRALREVETVLADYRSEDESQSCAFRSTAGEREGDGRARSRHRLGAESYLIVVDTERTRNDTAALLAASDLRLAQLQVALFRALGGGWQARRGTRERRRAIGERDASGADEDTCRRGR